MSATTPMPMPNPLDAAFRAYWSDRLAGGSPPRDERHARDAFYSGAAAALVRSRDAGHVHAWREVLADARAEQAADLAAAVGLPRLPIYSHGLRAS